MFDELKKDIQAVKERDPAARSSLEVLLISSGLHALMLHRPAHWLYRHKAFLPARLISQASRFLTGVEIHPGAKIGSGVMIDHGMGIVIGETAEVGDGCTIYQGVTLGGTGKDKGKRHPTLGKTSRLAAGRKFLGRSGLATARRLPPTRCCSNQFRRSRRRSACLRAWRASADENQRRSTTSTFPTLWRRRSAACALRSAGWSSVSGNWKRRSKNKRRRPPGRRRQPRRMGGKTRTGPAPRVHTARGGMGLTVCGQARAAGTAGLPISLFRRKKV